MSKYGFPDDEIVPPPAIELPTPKPRTEKPAPALVAEAVKAGQELGFVPREPGSPSAPASGLIPKRGGRRKSEPQDKLLVAGPARVIEAFREFCEQENIRSYWLALEMLMERAKRNED
ncbi:hypothetical protein V5F50_19765 [Xanthobacter sp. V13C-7B]|uniref:hypothetical protein n=1 Tax=Xanthobacter variabilis TaxID=3119932 RepID=UPI00372BB753